MSRVGKNPVALPQGVSVDLAGGLATVKGKLGSLKLPISSHVEVKVEGDKVWVKPITETKQARMSWGATRANLKNMVEGVSKGFTKVLEINGTGYRAAVQGKNLQLNLGFSHPVDVKAPEGITFEVSVQTQVIVSGIDKDGLIELDLVQAFALGFIVGLVHDLVLYGLHVTGYGSRVRAIRFEDQFARASRAYSDGDWEGVLPVLEEMNKRWPSHKGTLYLLIRCTTRQRTPMP